MVRIKSDHRSEKCTLWLSLFADAEKVVQGVSGVDMLKFHRVQMHDSIEAETLVDIIRFLR